jgi:hypothetical protein
MPGDGHREQKVEESRWVWKAVLALRCQCLVPLARCTCCYCPHRGTLPTVTNLLAADVFPIVVASAGRKGESAAVRAGAILASRVNALSYL